MAEMLNKGETHQTQFGMLIGTESGTMAVNRFCFGVELSGSYTSAEIFNVAANNKPKEFEQHHPAVDDWKLYNRFTWLPWKRLHRNVGESVLTRCKMHTLPVHSSGTLTEYMGGKQNYFDAWNKYIPTKDRLDLFSRFTRDLKGVRVLDIGSGCGNTLLELAAHNMDVYGIESHPEMYNQRSVLLHERIIFGDALECLAATIKPGSFDITLVSMTGYVWWHDMQDFLMRVRETVHVNGVVVLDILQHHPGTIRATSLYTTLLREVGLDPKFKTRDMIACVRTSR